MVIPPATNSVNGIAHKPGLFLHCGYATPKAHQYFPLPPPDAPIFIPDIETL
jgi:hypothetical protein